MRLDVGRGVNIQLNHARQRLRRDGGTAFDARVLDTRVSWQIDPRQRIRLSAQASEVERDPALYQQAVQARTRSLATQLLYSYKLNPRSALYAGWSQGGFSDDVQTGLFQDNRSLFLKLSYAWQP
jgi:hypothetical protein